jgi:putative glutathione S-transferase
MMDREQRGFASPVDYETYGRYVSNAKEQAHSLTNYAVRARFTDRISTDGSTPYPAEADRYHLYLALGCPWAHRAAIVVDLLGLAITYSFVDDVRDGRGWAFRETRGPDPINNCATLQQVYLLSDPTFEGHINVPTLWDRRTGRVVNNSDDDVFRDLVTRFGAIARNPGDIYRLDQREEIDALDTLIHESLNFGVYRIAVAANQADYDTLVERAFTVLDQLEERLATNRYLFGKSITETDIRLWVTLARFDSVYNPFFRVNLRRLVDYPNLWAYARDLYTHPAFARSTDFAACKATYYLAFPRWNPFGIVPAGPLLDWSEPQQRARLG